jgi:quercetin dioxygenase-like cupin family protein
MTTEPSENVGTRLMFENERVRVWDFALAPGETMERHVHRNDYFFLVTEGGRLRVGTGESENPHKEVEYHSDQITFVPVGENGTVHGPLTNVGDKPYRNFVIELK